MDNSEIRVFFIDPGDGEAVSKTEGLISSSVFETIKKKIPVTVFLAAYGNMAAGALAGAMYNGLFEIESIFVAPEFRRKGIGTALIDRLRQSLLMKDIMIRAEYTLENEEKKPLSSFFRSNGFSRERVKIPCYYLSTIGDLSAEQDERVRNKYEGSIIPFKEAGDSVLKTASAYSKNEGFPLPAGGLLSERVDKDLSFIALSNGRVMAYIAVEKDNGGLILIPALWSKIPDPKVMIAMLKTAAAKAVKKYPPEEQTAMMAISSVSEKIIRHLFPNSEAASYSFISR